MEKAKQVGTSSSSFTVDLFGPKESPKSLSSSTGFFGSIFGPASTGLSRDSSHSGIMSAIKNQDSGSQYAKPGTSDYMNQRNRRDTMNSERSSSYQNETVEPCYLSSSIYYGGQEVYSPAGHSTNSQQMNHFRKDGEEDDPNVNDSSCASRGNWWQGSLYY